MDPTYYETIRECARDIGRDRQTAIALQEVLTRSREPGAQFAARALTQAIEHYTKADQIVSTLATLASK